MELIYPKECGIRSSHWKAALFSLSVRRGHLYRMRLTVSWNLRSKYEEQKNHSFGKRIVGFLLLCVSAAEATGRFLKRR